MDQRELENLFILGILRNQEIKAFSGESLSNQQLGSMSPIGWRQGDGAPLSLVELATFSHPEEKKKSPVTKAKETLEKVVPKKKGKEEIEEKKERKEKKEKKEKAQKKEEVKEKKEKKVKKEEKEAPKEKKEKPKKKSPEKTK